MNHYKIISNGTPGMAGVINIETGEMLPGVQDIDIHLGMDDCFATVVLSGVIVEIDRIEVIE